MRFQWGWLEGTAPWNGWTHGAPWQYGCTHRSWIGGKAHAYLLRLVSWVRVKVRDAQRRSTPNG